MPNVSEKTGYEIKPEERQLMIEAGVTYYLKEKERYGEGWDPILVFDSEQFKRLPEDVQDEIKKMVAEKEKGGTAESPEVKPEEEKVNETMLRKMLLSYGIDPERSVAETIQEKENALRAAAQELEAQISKANLQECKRLLDREGLIEERLTGAEEGLSGAKIGGVEIHNVDSLRLLMAGTHPDDFEPKERYQHWIEYMDDFAPAYRGFEQEQLEYAERLRLQVEERLKQLLPTKERKGLGRRRIAIIEGEKFDEDTVREIKNELNRALPGITTAEKSGDEIAGEIERRKKDAILALALEFLRSKIAGAESPDQLDRLESQIAAEVKWYDDIDKSAISSLRSSLERREAGPQAPDELIDYWRRFVKPIDEKLGEAGLELIDNKAAVLRSAVKERKAVLRAEKDERVQQEKKKEQRRKWQEEGLPAAVQYQVGRIDEGLTKEFPKGKISEAVRARYAFFRALGAGEKVLTEKRRGELTAAQVAELWRQVIDRLMPNLSEPYTPAEIEQALSEVRSEKRPKQKEVAVGELLDYIAALRKIPELREREVRTEDPEMIKKELGEIFDYLTKVPVPLEVVPVSKGVVELRVSPRWLPRDLSVYVENPKELDVRDFDPGRNRGVIQLKRLVVDPKRRSKLAIAELVREYENFDAARAFEEGVREALKEHFAKKAGVSADEVSCPPHILATYLSEYAHQLPEFVEWVKVRPRRSKR